MGAVLNLSDHEITALGLAVALASLAISAFSIVLALRAISRSDKNSSAASLIAIYGGFHEAWRRFLGSKNDGERQYELSELMNLVEIGCAIHSEHSFLGASGELIEDYIQSSLWLLADDPDVRSRVPAMFNSPDTFKYIRRFLRLRRNAESLEPWSCLIRPPTSPVPRA